MKFFSWRPIVYLTSELAADCVYAMYMLANMHTHTHIYRTSHIAHTIQLHTLTNTFARTLNRYDINDGCGIRGMFGMWNETTLHRGGQTDVPRTFSVCVCVCCVQCMWASVVHLWLYCRDRPTYVYKIAISMCCWSNIRLFQVTGGAGRWRTVDHQIQIIHR